MTSRSGRISALFFLVLGLSIRDHGQAWLTQHNERLRLIFVWAFIGFLAFDALVLTATRNRLQQVAAESGAREAHKWLALLNLGSAVALVITALLDVLGPFLIAVVAIVRSVIDYVLSSRFLYPQTELSTGQGTTAK